MTEKQMREHLKKIWFHYSKLRKALNAAHNKELVVYTGYQLGPCFQMDNLKDAIEKTTNEQIARIVHSAVKSEIPY